MATRSAAKGESGRVRVGFVGSATYALLPRLLPAFRSRYPQVELELRESTNSNVGLLEAERLESAGALSDRERQHLSGRLIERDVFARPAALPSFGELPFVT